MSTLIIQTVPLALAAAISPVLFLLQLETVTGTRPIARGSALTAGAAFVLIAVSSVAVALGVTALSGNESLQAAVKIGFGALLLALGVRCVALSEEAEGRRRPTRDRRASDAPSSPARRGWPRTSRPSLSTSPRSLSSPTASCRSARSGSSALIILVLTLMVAWVPLAIAVAVPGASSSWLPRFGAWMTRNDRWIQVTLGVGFGLLLLVKGIGAL